LAFKVIQGNWIW